MATRTQKVKVVVFLLVNVAALAALLLYIGGYGRGESVPYWVEFSESILGLGEGSIVEFKGVPIGKVNAIRVTDEGLAHVDIRIDPSKAELHDGVKAKLVIYSLATGMMAISLEGGERTAPPLKPGSQIPASPSIVQNFVIQVQDVLDDVRTMTGQVRKGLEGMKEGELTETVRNMNQLVEDGRKFIATADTSLKSLTEKAEPGVQSFQELMTTTKILAQNTNDLVQALKTQVDALHLSETEKTFQDVARNTNDLVGKLATTSETLTKVTNSVSANVDSTEYTLRETLKALDDTLTAVRELADYLRQDPASLLRGRGEPVRSK